MTLWRRSSRCDSGHCAEVALDGDLVLVRHSRDAGKPHDETTHLAYTCQQWRDEVCSLLFVTEFAMGPVARIDEDTYAWCGVDAFDQRQVLWFDGAEWAAFVGGVRAGEFRFDRMAGAVAGG
jgi:hypothetical protein